MLLTEKYFGNKGSWLIPMNMEHNIESITFLSGISMLDIIITPQPHKNTSATTQHNLIIAIDIRISFIHDFIFAMTTTNVSILTTKPKFLLW